MNYESKTCEYCGSNHWNIKPITWSTNGTTVHKLKCRKCKEVEWVTKDFDIITIVKKDEENQLELMF